MKRKLGLAALILLSFSTAAAAQGFGGELRSLKVGDEITVNATVSNPLPMPDSFTVKFEGSALEQQLAVINYSAGASDDCEDEKNLCEIDVGPEGENDIQLSINGTAIGDGSLIASVNSSITQLESTDRMEIRVEPYYGATNVAAPGITLLQVLFLAGAGTVLTGMAVRD